MKNIYLAGVAVALALSAQALGPSVRIQPSSASQPLGTPQRFDIPARQSGMGGPVMRLGENSPLKPPFTETFDNLRLGMEHDDFSRYFQVIDANQDGREWGLYNYADFKPYGRCAYMLFPMEDVRSADDWLVTRAIQLEAGKYYAITLDAALYRDATPEFAQRFEVKIGSYNDPDGLKTTVIEPTDIYSTTFSHHRGWFSPRVSGKYYVGVHGISPMYKNYYNYLFVDNIGVDAPKNGTEPNEVTDVEFVNDPTGSTRLDITFKAPAVNVANRPLSGKISAITVKRDGSVIKTFTDVEPGAALSLSDTPSSEGEYGYEFQVDNAGESGVPVFIRHYAGVGAPMAPASIAILENSDHSVEITWEEPTADVNGTPINPEALVYNIYQVVDGKAELIGSTDAVNVFDYEPEIAEGNQVLLSVAVTATLREKESDPVVSSEIPLGTPYGLPHHNSFNNEDYYRYIMTMERDD